MNIAICNIIEQDEISGFYSLNKSKTTDFKLLTFCGKANGNFVNLKTDMNDEKTLVNCLPVPQGLYFQHIPLPVQPYQ